MTYSLLNLRLPDTDKDIRKSSITISDGIFQYIGQKNHADMDLHTFIDFSDKAIAFPGLINSHDHLDFNVFPILKTRIYCDYIEWARDIHYCDEFKHIIEKLKNKPLKIKILYGLIKNIICGVTTVINHGKRIDEQWEVIDIFQNCTVLHSYQYESWLALKINIAPYSKPITIHMGEGKTPAMYKEVNRILAYNITNKDIIGVHGINLNRKQAQRMRALIWCPQSNHVLYGQTAEINEFKDSVPILFGTDSSLSSHWNLWEHIRLAKSLNYMNDMEILDALTTTPAEIWKLPLNGKITEGYTADLVIAKRKSNSYWKSFNSLEPVDILAVFKHGKLVYFDDSLLAMLPNSFLNWTQWSKISLDNTCKYLPAVLMHELVNEIEQFDVLPIKLVKHNILLENHKIP